MDHYYTALSDCIAAYLQLLGNGIGAPPVAAENIGAQAKGTVIGQCHQLRICLELDDCHHWAEDFFPVVVHSTDRKHALMYGCLISPSGCKT